MNKSTIGIMQCDQFYVWKSVIVRKSEWYVGETTRHFSTRVREHLVTDKASHIFKHL